MSNIINWGGCTYRSSNTRTDSISQPIFRSVVFMCFIPTKGTVGSTSSAPVAPSEATWLWQRLHLCITSREWLMLQYDGNGFGTLCGERLPLPALPWSYDNFYKQIVDSCCMPQYARKESTRVTVYTVKFRGLVWAIWHYLSIPPLQKKKYIIIYVWTGLASLTALKAKCHKVRPLLNAFLPHINKAIHRKNRKHNPYSKRYPSFNS